MHDARRQRAVAFGAPVCLSAPTARARSAARACGACCSRSQHTTPPRGRWEGAWRWSCSRQVRVGAVRTTHGPLGIPQQSMPPRPTVSRGIWCCRTRAVSPCRPLRITTCPPSHKPARVLQHRHPDRGRALGADARGARGARARVQAVCDRAVPPPRPGAARGPAGGRARPLTQSLTHACGGWPLDSIHGLRLASRQAACSHSPASRDHQPLTDKQPCWTACSPRSRAATPLQPCTV